MTSTSFNVGLSDIPRPSSRVLRPPGGGHTDIFGGEPEPQRTGRRMNNPAQIAAAASAEAAGKSSISEVPEQNGQSEAPQAEAAPPTAAPAPVADEPVSNTAAQAAAEPAVTAQAKVQQSLPETNAPKRVRVPPGGFSSGLW